MKPIFTLLAAIGLTLPAIVQGQQLESWLKILPPNTVGYFAVKNAPELLADWEGSGFGRLIADEEIKKWMAPLYKDGEAAWDSALKKETGEGLHANLQHVTGSAMLVFAADSPEDFNQMGSTGAPFLILLEVGDQQAKLEELITKSRKESLEKHPEWKEITRDIAGVPLQVLAHSEEPDAKIDTAHAFVDGVLVFGDKLALFEHYLPALKTQTAQTSDTVAGHLARISQHADGTGDVTFYLNGETLMKWAESGLAEAMKTSKSPVPLDPKAILSALGLNELQSIGVSVDFTAAQARTDAVILHPEKPQGILTLLRGTQAEVPQPAFFPADILGAQVMRQSLGGIWDSILGMVNKLGPVAMVATVQIGQIEQQMGFSIKDDLFGSLEDEYIQANAGTAEAPSQVMGFKVRDRQRLAGALESLKRFIGQGFGAAFEDSEYLGHTISTYRASQAAAPGTASMEIAYCLADGYLLFSTGSQELLKKLLARMKEPSGPSIWDSQRTQDLIAALPAGYVGLSVADASEQLLTIINAMSAVQKQTAGKKKSTPAKKKGPGKAAKDAAEAADSGSSDGPATWFDASAQPGPEVFKKYLGTEVGGTYSHPQAIH
ncbi:MAG: hypothetical protein LDL31_06180, partial [Prosthecobacter sp.]|nr:hypothetical protein [Prosthecobacter sp.]